MRTFAVLILSGILAACARDVPDAELTGDETNLASVSAPQSRLEALRDDADNAAFASVTEPIEFEFPRDHGPHPAFRHEWWYVTGNLDAENGEHFGFQLTFFRFALAPALAPNPSANASAWRTRQIYMAHFAITDVAQREFHFAQRLARDAVGLAGARAEPFRVWLEDWSIEAQPPSGNWTLRAAAGDYELTLETRPLVQAVLNGERGLSRKSSDAGAASYYYSIPRLAAQGRIVRAGEPVQVHGLAWLDREWGSGALASDQAGWDWFALQLDDGSALMFYALRKRDGTRDRFSAGTWIEPDGTPRALKSDDVMIEVQDHWQSPRGGRYPSRWQLVAPSLGLDISLHPLLADQELQTDPRYWEGAVRLTGKRAGREVAGTGYVELVGYADALRQ